jgi:hypothetical protein
MIVLTGTMPALADLAMPKRRVVQPSDQTVVFHAGVPVHSAGILARSRFVAAEVACPACTSVAMTSWNRRGRHRAIVGDPTMARERPANAAAPTGTRRFASIPACAPETRLRRRRSGTSGDDRSTMTTGEVPWVI